MQLARLGALAGFDVVRSWKQHDRIVGRMHGSGYGRVVRAAQSG